MTKQDIKTVVLGLGNPALGDDGIGPRIVMDMREKFLHPGLTYLISGHGGLELIDLLKGYTRAVIIDGIRTRDGSAGDMYFMDSGDYVETLHLSNFHDTDFLTTINLAGKLSIEMPGKISIVAIEIEEDQVFTSMFTPSLANKYADILQSTLNYLETDIFSSTMSWIRQGVDKDEKQKDQVYY